MTIQEYLKSISLEGEVWTMVPDHSAYYMSNLHRAASTNGCTKNKPCKLIRIFRNKTQNRDYFYVCEYSVRSSVYFEENEYNPQKEDLKAEILSIKKQKKIQQCKDDAHKMALEMFGSIDSPEYKQYYHILEESALMFL